MEGGEEMAGIAKGWVRRNALVLMCRMSTERVGGRGETVGRRSAWLAALV